jgi:tRNA 2-thiocytidine biosynthesis protein TtcA
MHDFGMLDDGDTVFVAVSGGIDSLVAAWVLQIWRAKAPISYEVQAVYVDNVHGLSDPKSHPVGSQIREQVERFGIPFTRLAGWGYPEEVEQSCFICARYRRTQLFDFVRQRGGRKLALGHHKDDLIETFLINALYSGNISTMVPRQDLFGGRLSIIRPLAYLEKDEIAALAGLADLTAVKNRCPLAGITRRETLRPFLERLYEAIPGSKESLFSALGNVREDYLLSKRNSWK